MAPVLRAWLLHALKYPLFALVLAITASSTLAFTEHRTQFTASEQEMPTCTPELEPSATGCLPDETKFTTPNPRNDAPASAAAASTPAVRCHTGGYGVQAILLVNPGQTPTSTAVAAARKSLWQANERVKKGSGGARELRVVTEKINGTCVPAVQTLTFDQNSTNLAWKVWSQARTSGYAAKDRLYVLMGRLRGYEYCGQAPATPWDLRKTPLNDHNVGPRYAYSECYATDSTTTLHEIIHAIGGVLQGAPHGTAGSHCTDGQDLMCYQDAADTPTKSVCLAGGENLDCNNDTYFNVSPDPTSWLGRNWNTADSSFMYGGIAPPQPTTERPSKVTNLRVVDKGKNWATLTWDAPADGADVSYQVKTGGNTATFGTTATTFTVTGLTPQANTAWVTAQNSAGVSAPVIVNVELNSDGSIADDAAEATAPSIKVSSPTLTSPGLTPAWSVTTPSVSRNVEWRMVRDPHGVKATTYLGVHTSMVAKKFTLPAGARVCMTARWRAGEGNLRRIGAWSEPHCVSTWGDDRALRIKKGTRPHVTARSSKKARAKARAWKPPAQRYGVGRGAGYKRSTFTLVRPGGWIQLDKSYARTLSVRFRLRAVRGATWLTVVENGEWHDPLRVRRTAKMRVINVDTFQWDNTVKVRLVNTGKYPVRLDGYVLVPQYDE